MFFQVIIPMAGEGQRFGKKFKPFLKLDDRMFIEHVMDPFLNYDANISSYNFIITKEQEEINNVYQTIFYTFKEIKEKIQIWILPNATEGPYQTITFALKNKNIDNLIICDCDHQIYIEAMLNYITNSISQIDICIPTWKIYPEEYKNWGKVLLQNDAKVDFFEKEEIYPKKGEQLYGMIGCYYFKNSNILDYNNKYINISDFLKNNKTNYNIQTFKIEKAYFFGTPEMVKEYIQQKRCHENVICDIDGVLFYHQPHSTTNSEENNLIKNCIEKINNWKTQNKKIILMTSRSKKTRIDFSKLLKEKNIPFDELIMGVNPGTRYVVNDIKPSNIFTKQSIEINLERNIGIDDIICEEFKNNYLQVIQILKGGSFSKVYLIQNTKTNKIFVRKHIIKSKNNMEHYYRLKRQSEDLKRFYFYNKLIVPKILCEEDFRFDYFYDMEYFDNYKQLNQYDLKTQHNVCKNIIQILNKDVYIYKKPLKNQNFIHEFMEEKIYPKLEIYKNIENIMHYLINNEYVIINGKQYYGLLTIIKKINIEQFSPTFICPIHGDLNFENILYNSETQDFKLIDMEGSRYMDSPVFDLGKIFQSVISQYEKWSQPEKQLIFDETFENIKCTEDFFIYDKNMIEFIIEEFQNVLDINSKTHIIKTGIFYMATYFIRFIPFTMKISRQHGIFSMIMAIIWLNHIVTIKI